MLIILICATPLSFGVVIGPDLRWSMVTHEPFSDGLGRLLSGIGQRCATDLCNNE